MGVKQFQPSFAGGEISPSLYARIDLARYGSGLRACRNMIVRQYGGVMNRPGTRFVAECDDSSRDARLIPFRFNNDQTYVIEFGHNVIRFVQRGALIAAPAGTAYSSGTTYAINDYVTSGGIKYRSLQGGNTNHTPASSPAWWKATDFYEISSPYPASAIRRIRYVQSVDVMTLTHPDYKPMELSRFGQQDWRLSEFAYENGPFLEANTDDGITVYASAETGAVTLTASSGIFTPEHVGGLFKLEQADLSEIPPWEPGKELVRAAGATPFGLMRRSDGKVYRCVTSRFNPNNDRPIQTGTVRPVHEKGVAADGDGSGIKGQANIAGVEWEYLHSGYGIVLITGYTSPTSVTGTVIARLPSTTVGGTVTGGSWSHTGDGSQVNFSITGAGRGSASDYEVVVDGEVVNPGDYTVNPVSDILTFVIAPASSAAISIKEMSASNLTYVWYFGAWSEAYGWPSVATYYQDRLCFANNRHRPQTVWCSKSGDYKNFGVSAPSIDDDALTFTIGSRDLNEIRDLISIDSLIVLTSAGEWRVTEGQDQVLAPETVGIRAQSYNGAADVQSAIIGRSALYVQDRGAFIRDLSYSFADDGYNGIDRSLFSEHLFDGYQITELAYSQIPNRVMWAIRDDGLLLSFTFLPEQEVAGWARHDTDGAYSSACCIPEDDEDVAYFIVIRTIGGAQKRYIERLPTRKVADQVDAFFVDSGLTYDGRHYGSTTMTLSGASWAAGDTMSLTASAGTFGAGDVGDNVVFSDANGQPVRTQIVGYTSPTSVDVEALDPVPAELQGVAIGQWTLARSTFSGLDHLEGKTVAILSDGNVVEPRVVSGGSITLDFPGGVVHAGLPIVAEIEGLDIANPGGQEVRTLVKDSPTLWIIVQESRGFLAGTARSELFEDKGRSFEPYVMPASRISDCRRINITSKWDKNSRFIVRQENPLPLTVLGTIFDVNTGGSE